jgi:lipopolysaccharide export system protein LptA
VPGCEDDERVRMRRAVAIWLGLAVWASAVENLEVSADKFEHLEKEKKAIFRGHAHATQGKSRIDARKFVVYFDDRGETREYQALGKVRFEIIKPNRHIKGRCDRLVYNVAADTYRLSGHTYLQDLINKRTMSGKEIFLDNRKGKATAVSDRKGPVKFVFPMKDTKGGKKKKKGKR